MNLWNMIKRPLTTTRVVTKEISRKVDGGSELLSYPVEVVDSVISPVTNVVDDVVESVLGIFE